MGSSRFVREAAQEETVAFVKTVSAKPVVGVGRFTSPDTMVRQVNKGILDFIGAARPSIADPFLPRKIEDGRLEDIRECIGCNICYAHDSRGVPIRCTQNPTMGEEWRLAWHPEKIAPRHADETVLVVGGGPAGLEAARALGQRGYAVTLAEATAELGGRVSRESRLPGLAEWARVRDWRLGQLTKLTNVDVYLESELSAAQVLDFGFRHVIVATGARWRRDGLGRQRATAFAGSDLPGVVTPDDIMDGHMHPRALILDLRRRQLLHGLRPGAEAARGGPRGGPGHQRGTGRALEPLHRRAGIHHCRAHRSRGGDRHQPWARGLRRNRSAASLRLFRPHDDAPRRDPSSRSPHGRRRTAFISSLRAIRTGSRKTAFYLVSRIGDCAGRPGPSRRRFTPATAPRAGSETRRTRRPICRASNRFSGDLP